MEVRYPCDKCHFAATSAGSLKLHIEGKPIGVRYPFDNCEYKATTVENLNKHKNSQHKEVRYLCDKCEFATNTPRSLEIHKCEDMAATETYIQQLIQSTHSREERAYPCDKCEYVAKSELLLRQHLTRMEHEGFAMMSLNTINEEKDDEHIEIKEEPLPSYIEQNTCTVYVQEAVKVESIEIKGRI